MFFTLIIFHSSCFLLRFADDIYSDATFISTIGVDFKIKTIQLDGQVVKLQIWDTAGQERFRTITSSYYRGAHGIVICYDVTDERSFESIAKWRKEVDTFAGGAVTVMICGMKADLDKERVVTKERGEALAARMNTPFMETSAKTNTNVSLAMETIARAVMIDRNFIQPAVPVCERDERSNRDMQNAEEAEEEDPFSLSSSGDESFSASDLENDLDDVVCKELNEKVNSYSEVSEGSEAWESEESGVEFEDDEQNTTILPSEDGHDSVSTAVPSSSSISIGDKKSKEMEKLAKKEAEKKKKDEAKKKAKEESALKKKGKKAVASEDVKAGKEEEKKRKEKEKLAQKNAEKYVREKLKSEEKKRRARGVPRPSTRHVAAKTNTNIFSLSLSALQEEPVLMTGDPHICQQCGVMLSGQSPVQQVQPGQEAATVTATNISLSDSTAIASSSSTSNPSTSSSSSSSSSSSANPEEVQPVEFNLVPAPPIHEKFENQSALLRGRQPKREDGEHDNDEDDDDDEEDEEDKFIWSCEFCGFQNALELDSIEELPKFGTVDYLVTPAPQM